MTSLIDNQFRTSSITFNQDPLSLTKEQEDKFNSMAEYKGFTFQSLKDAVNNYAPDEYQNLYDTITEFQQNFRGVGYGKNYYGEYGPLLFATTELLKKLIKAHDSH